MMEEPKKPLCLEYEEAKNDIYSVLNTVMGRKTLPLFAVDNILKDALRQIEEGAKNELIAAKSIYAKQLEEYKKKG